MVRSPGCERKTKGTHKFHAKQMLKRLTWRYKLWMIEAKAGDDAITHGDNFAEAVPEEVQRRSKPRMRVISRKRKQSVWWTSMTILDDQSIAKKDTVVNSQLSSHET